MVRHARIALRTALTLALLLGASSAFASAPAAGLYEAYSPVTMRPVGLLSSAQARSLPRWLAVSELGDGAVRVVFEPEQRVVWTLRYGAAGRLLDKVVNVDGKRFATSTFGYTAGRLVSKRVDGPLGQSTYRYTSQGATVTRTLDKREPVDPSKAGTQAGLVYTQHHSSKGIKATFRDARGVVRVDSYTRSGVLMGTTFGEGAARLSLVYDRDRDGRLQSIVSKLPGAGSWTYQPKVRRTGVTGVHLSMLRFPVERHEVLYLLGEPVTARQYTDGVGDVDRDDSYSEGCWLNEISSLSYRASGALHSASQGCICGFCVLETPSAAAGDVVMEADVHWTRGPWLRINGQLTITEEHRVITPTGPRPAGLLRVGDTVLSALGDPVEITSIASLGDAVERRGLNLRTRSGTFAAGGLLLESETARPCHLQPR